VAWSPDGKWLATGSWDSTAKVWDAASGRELHVLRGHNDYISSVAWSPNDKRLATGSWDQTVKVWDAASGQELLTLRGHNEKIESVSWSLDGKRLATADLAGMVQIYAMDVRDLMPLARQRVTAPLSDQSCKKYLQVVKCPPVPTLSP